MARGRPSKKGQITAAAQRLFCELGYQGTSIDQVVIEAGVSKPTVYSNFPSKLSLWQEVLEEQIQVAKNDLADVFSNSNDTDFENALIKSWQTWVGSEVRLAAYRIHWGESHKMLMEQTTRFAMLENVFAEHVSKLANRFSVSSQALLMANLLAKDAFLIRRLGRYSDASLPYHTNINGEETPLNALKSSLSSQLSQVLRCF